MKKILKTLGMILVLAASVVVLYSSIKPLHEGLLSSTRDRVSYVAMGTSTSSPATLSETYSDNRIEFNTAYLNNLHIDLSYAPSSTNAYAMVLLEASNDSGQSWFPVGAKSVDTQEIDLYVEDFDGNIGLPVVFPGDKTSVTGTTYASFIDFDFVGDRIRISAKEGGSPTASGTLYMAVTLSAE